VFHPDQILWVHETTLKSKSELDTWRKQSVAAGVSTESESELFNWHERTAENKLSGIIQRVS